MNTIAIIISLIALVGAGFAFLRASSSHRILIKRIEKLKDKNTYLEERLKRLEGGGRNRRSGEETSDSGRGRKQADELSESGRGRNQPRQEQQQEQVREPRQKQRDRQQGRQPQERQPQERQPQEQRQQERPPRDRQAQEGQADDQETGQQGQHRRRRGENRRRNEPMDRNAANEMGEHNSSVNPGPVSLEFAGGDLLAELEQAAAGQQQMTTANQVSQPEPVQNVKRYAIIPEDGVIRQHQLQQQPDSDSYIEVDAPAEGSSRTRYRFNLAGNHAFVISQGIDRLENAFAFEKPSNRMVSQVVLQGDGVLSRVGNGWKIEEKARIDFR